MTLLAFFFSFKLIIEKKTWKLAQLGKILIGRTCFFPSLASLSHSIIPHSGTSFATKLPTSATSATSTASPSTI
jgi:Na+/phosphate symporter